MILIIDNYDSFVHNLARYVRLAGWDYKIVRNDEITIEQVKKLNPAGIVLSPGPRTPQESGICVELVRTLGENIPILGVCLGHQCIAAAYNAPVTRANQPVHGKASAIHHDGSFIFQNLPSPFQAGRYHSLIAQAPGNDLTVTARTLDGDIMALRHKQYPVYGVQFHPESILTEHGLEIIRNFSGLAIDWNARRAAA